MLKHPLIRCPTSWIAIMVKIYNNCVYQTLCSKMKQCQKRMLSMIYTDYCSFKELYNLEKMNHKHNMKYKCIIILLIHSLCLSISLSLSFSSFKVIMKSNQSNSSFHLCTISHCYCYYYCDCLLYLMSVIPPVVQRNISTRNP